MDDVGTRFAHLVAAKDRDGLVDLFAPAVDFRGMTPGSFWESTRPSEVVDDIILGNWFEEHDVIERLESVESAIHVDRHRVDYCLRVRTPDELCLVEQRCYFDLDPQERIAKMNVICSGYRRIGPA